ncbi:MAG: hypothetical protein WCG78_00190 [Candidatus Omnitrophota bacterium]
MTHQQKWRVTLIMWLVIVSALTICCIANAHHQHLHCVGAVGIQK